MKNHSLVIYFSPTAVTLHLQRVSRTQPYSFGHAGGEVSIRNDDYPMKLSQEVLLQMQQIQWIGLVHSPNAYPRAGAFLCSSCSLLSNIGLELKKMTPFELRHMSKY